jgi:hypothetical protein
MKKSGLNLIILINILILDSKNLSKKALIILNSTKIFPYFYLTLFIPTPKKYPLDKDFSKIINNSL